MNEITTNNSFAYINKKLKLERLANRGDLCSVVRKTACLQKLMAYVLFTFLNFYLSYFPDFNQYAYQ